MNWLDIVLLALVAAAVVAAVLYTKRHQGSCGCGCRCNGCTGCDRQKTEE